MKVVWTIKNLVDVAKQRQANEFDYNIIVSGARGNGKSSFAFKYLCRFGKKFKPWKHQIYSRKDVMKLLEKLRYGCIFDDEAIRTGYKRNFFEQDQKLLIQMLNLYRDNFNVYVACLPSFYDLDKGLRDLFKVHLHIVERGLGVVHVANESLLYSSDKWDVKYNQKIEEGWAKRKQKNLKYKPRYDRLTTFRGYLKIPRLTPKQEALYKEIKETKRKLMYEEEIKEEEEGIGGFYDRLIDRLKQGKLTTEMLQEIALANGLKYSAVRNLLNVKIKNIGEDKTVSDYIVKKVENFREKAVKGYRKPNIELSSSPNSY